jgi:DNA-binding transcriptional MerR regulator/methylmalonyl-CoA mutase cobalamin-binding subunit
MGIVAERTGISPHVIRAWERRHGAVAPQRTSGNRRLYTQADIDRLLLLKHAVEGGYSIAQLAKLSLEELRGIGGSPSVGDDSPRSFSRDVKGYGEYLTLALDAIRELRADKLEEALGRAAVEQGREALVKGVVPTLLHEIGELWRQGQIRTYHEQMAASVIRSVLGRVISRGAVAESSLSIVLATPRGAFHEFGSLMAATAAQMASWRVLHLGASLPAEEIAGAAIEARVRAVGLSVVYPAEDPQVQSEISELRRLLPSDVALLIGGRAARGYRRVEGNVTFLDSLDAFMGELELLSVID